MKNFDSFKEAVVNALGAIFESAKVTTNKVTKNNSLVLEGVVIIAPNKNISPTIYLNGFYEEYLNGRALEDIVNTIVSIYKESAPDMNFDVESFTNWNRAKDNLICCLVNYERNIELLSQVPHIKFLDLAIIFKCLVSSDSNGSATILVKNEHLAFWNISEGELYEVAKANTPKMLPADLKNMLAVLMEMFDGNMLEEFDDASEYPMYVLTNKTNLNGSACILYENVLKDFADKIGSDFYILPSSVHESILLPTNSRMEKEELKEMVESVNATQVAPEDFLSDNVYYYDREQQKITM